MIVVDPSSIMTIVFEEEGYEAYVTKLRSSRDLVMSAGSALELEVVSWRRGKKPLRDKVEQLMRSFRISVLPMDLQQVAAAKTGFAQFGKGRHETPSALNFGDCFTYALAKTMSAPILFKGDDFTKTDADLVLLPQ
ncbi:MAG: type II toxin-antitoxin system VapC family toxin [Pseudomonadota bacterium]